MIVPPGILKNNKVHIVPLVAEVLPIDGNAPKYDSGRKNSATISFIAKSASMVPVPDPVQEENSKRLKLSEYELDEDMEALADRNIIFVRQLPQDLERYINVPNKYQVVNSRGETIFDVIETTDGITRRLFRRDQPFTMRMINSYGEYICELIGDPGIGGLGAYVKLRRESTNLGKVVQVNPFFACCNCTPKYQVHDGKGKLVSRIKGQRGGLKGCVFSDDFHVYSASGKASLVGSISRQTKAICLEDYSQADTYALSFQDAQMDRIEKALLIAAVIMLDFQFFEGREGSDLWKVGVCCLIVVLVGLIVAGIAVWIISASAK